MYLYNHQFLLTYRCFRQIALSISLFLFTFIFFFLLFQIFLPYSLNSTPSDIPSSIINYELGGSTLSNISSSLNLSNLSNIDLSNLKLEDISGIDLSTIDYSSIIKQLGFRKSLLNRQAKQDVNGDGVVDAQDLADALEKYQNNQISQADFFTFLQDYYQEVGMNEEGIKVLFEEYMNNIQEQIKAFQENSEKLKESAEEFRKELQVINKQLQQYYNQLSKTRERKTNIAEQLSIRYSRRILEFGREAFSSVAIRAKRRRASYEYQAAVRDTIFNVRKTFFTILLKKKQIEARENSLKDFEEKYEKLQKRFEKAQDVLKIDILTAELDVLNERLEINSLKKEKSQLKTKNGNNKNSNNHKVEFHAHGCG